MSVFIKKSKLRVKNEDGTSYTGVMNAVAEESTEELIKQIEAKGEEVVAKGKKTLESIPEDYTVLEEIILISYIICLQCLNPLFKNRR